MEEKSHETIKHAAVKSVDGWIFIGKSHPECIHKMHCIKVKTSPHTQDEGFITSEGRYVQRGEAARIAFESGQTDTKLDRLYSEDLWSIGHGGKFKYSEIEGYLLNLSSGGDKDV